MPPFGRLIAQAKVNFNVENKWVGIKFMEVQHGNSQQVTNLFCKAFRLRGPRKSYQWKRISKEHKLMVEIQTAHAKLGSQNGNSREHISRSLMIIK